MSSQLNHPPLEEFCDNVATEKWIMQGGRLRIEGESVDTSKDEGSGGQGPDEVFDGAGNKIEAGCEDGGCEGGWLWSWWYDDCNLSLSMVAWRLWYIESVYQGMTIMG